MKVCFGIDFNGGNPVVVRAERVRGKVAASVVSMGDLGIRSFAAGSMSVRESFTRWLEAPFSAESKARKVLPTILDVQLPFPLEECAYDFISVSGNEGIVKALAVGARADDVKTCLTAYAKLGVDVQVLDQDGVAMWERGLVEVPVAEGESDLVRIIVNLNRDRSTLVLGCGREFISAYSVRSDDGGRVTRLLEVGLKERQKGRVRWLFAGNGAKDDNLVEAFLALAGDRWKGRHEVIREPVSFLARALAIRGLSGSGCNLRSGALVHQDILTAGKRKILAPLIVLFVAGLIMIGANIAVVSALEMKERKLDASFQKLADKVAGYRVSAKGKDALLKVKRKVDDRGVAARPFLMAFDKSLTVLLREILDAGQKSGLNYEIVSLSHASDETAGEKGDILIKGSAAGWNGCDDLTGVLRRSGYVVNVDRKDALADERIPFTLRTGAVK